MRHVVLLAQRQRAEDQARLHLAPPGPPLLVVQQQVVQQRHMEHLCASATRSSARGLPHLSAPSGYHKVCLYQAAVALLVLVRRHPRRSLSLFAPRASGGANHSMPRLLSRTVRPTAALGTHADLQTCCLLLHPGRSQGAGFSVAYDLVSAVLRRRRNFGAA